MTTTEAQSERPPSETEGVATDRLLTEFGQGARGLLERQRTEIRTVEAKLGSQIASLFQQVASERQETIDHQKDLVSKLEQLSERERLAQASQQQAEALFAEAREGLASAMHERKDLREQLAAANELLAVRTEELDRIQNGQQAGETDTAELADLRAKLSELKVENDQLREALSEAESRDAGNESEQQNGEVRVRLEQAVEELRAEKDENDRLSAENRRLRQESENGGRQVLAAASTDGFDWESQKQALIEQMESDLDASNPVDAKSKLTIEGAIRITDQVVAEKDAEIQDLQKLLANQSSSIGDVAVGAAAIAEMLDHDELIRDERENLARMQDEWREKMRRAEIDVSVERAKIARERAELEERLRAFEDRADSLGIGMDEPASAKGSRGNWLSRLGLKDE